MMFNIYYLCVKGGSGLTRMLLTELPQWLEDHPGHMIIKIENLERPFNYRSNPAESCVRQD